jgi:DNA-binding LacI/PurR family transcriptional regulator
MLQAPVAASAFFSQHLAITTELLRALNRADISVPEQASVLGFDELPNAEFFKVPVTVIEQDPHRIGASAAQCLLDKIAEPSRAEQRVMIPCRLIKRSSCAAPAG